LVNELAIIFHRLGIDTLEVLEAAGTKWNFLPFRPGLVGGHCIGVDPYYLTHKAEAVGHHPEVILAGRRINDGMGRYVARETVKELVAAGFELRGARVTVLGLTFKEDCSDLRNSQVVTLVEELCSFGVDVRVHDPVASQEAAQSEYGIELVDWDAIPRSDALVLAVAHRGFLERGLDGLGEKLGGGGCLVDIKSRLDPKAVRDAGFRLWRL